MFENRLIELIESLRRMFAGLTFEETVILIFLNNAKASLIALVTGIFFGVVPLWLAVLNGYLLGFVSRIVSSESSFIELWRILPHGIFELPAVLLSIAMGLRIGMEILNKKTRKNFFYNLTLSLKVFFILIIPMLVIAAIIEGILIFFG
jgi:stage II sporulation protein M